MLDLLHTLFTFIVALALLITVHEYGHFWVARRMGVKVLRFSVGFGRPLMRYQCLGDRQEWHVGHRLVRSRPVPGGGDGGVGPEYVLAAIPLGGYVKMLDEREGEVAPEERHLAFNRASLGRRAAIVAAGPIANLIFAVLAYWAMYMVGIPGLRPILAEVPVETPAWQAGLRGGEEVMAIAGRTTPTWDAVLDELLPHALRRSPVTLEVNTGGQVRAASLPLGQLPEGFKAEQLDRLGLLPQRPVIPPVVAKVLPDSAAATAGLLPGDRILALADQEVAQWHELVEIVQANPGRPLEGAVLRDGVERSFQIRPHSVAGDEGPVGRIGVEVVVDEAAYERLRTELSYGPGRALAVALGKTWETSWLTLEFLGRMLVGNASTENISGPITIARIAKHSADGGLGRFLRFLAVVSISLAVLNLLPIPVLDGGHLFFYLIEAIKGSPLSEEAEIMGQKVGLTLILMLMSLALYNDLALVAK